MKNKLLIIALFVLSIGVCYSQNKTNKNDSLSKYVGVYYFVHKNVDSTIKYDYITFYEKKGKLYCSRDFMFSYVLAGSVKQQPKYHQEYEVLSINPKENSVTLKYEHYKCTYKFRKNIKGNLELVISEMALIYERR